MLKIWKFDHYAMHDGPGIRTAVYLKGCQLRCLWCSNPEGQTIESNLVFHESRCINCGRCAEKCQKKALSLEEDPETLKIKHRLDRSKCELCGECVSVCFAKALEIWGEDYEIGDVLKIIEKNRHLYRKSGGGVTLTGGDPICQGDAVLALLKECRKRGIHTAIETSAAGDEEAFAKIVEEVDWMFIDLKHMDPQEHFKLTGKPNELIHRNLQRASTVLGKRDRILVVRMVVVPGFNDGDNILKAAEFLHSLPYLKGVEFLPYHRYGVNKFELLDRQYRLTDLAPASEEETNKCKNVMAGFGISVI